jgi:hypothetical protein
MRKVSAYSKPWNLGFDCPPKGNVKTISGNFKKSDLCQEHRLNVSVYRARAFRTGVLIEITNQSISHGIYARLTHESLISCQQSWYERTHSW